MTLTRVLIANRGEIAVRIARAAAELGVESVAVYAADEPDAPHVAKADSAVALAGSGAAAYLDVDDVLRVAVQVGADAVHPGYGFLSENPGFARACAARGVVFVGPAADVLERLGDKTRARELAAELGIPLLAGTGPVEQATAEVASAEPRARDGGSVAPVPAVRAADAVEPASVDVPRGGRQAAAGLVVPDDAGGTAVEELVAAVGFPVMVKAVAGGGGRGMRRVFASDGLADALVRCAAEASAAFGDGRVYVEQLLVPARHVEVQILGDGTGAVIALGERDCSVQRRHQKIVEVAPAPGLAAEVREELLAAAVRIGRAVRYAGAGTVEFLVSGSTFVFLEVNPRLQVEHPVTEEVTGVDLVAAQLRLAGGATLAALGLERAPAVRGTAVQARITLERTDADGSTTPTAGTVTAFELPTGRGVRVDAAGYVGYRTSLRYDPLIAKLIVSAPDFAGLVVRARRALSEVHIGGVETNVDVLAGIVGHPAFAAGELTTDFLADHLADVLAARRPRRYVDTSASSATSASTVAIGSLHECGFPAVAPHECGFPAVAPHECGFPAVAPHECGFPAVAPHESGFPAIDADVSGTVLAHTPGTVVAVEAAEGDAVRAGQALVVLEAMKMQHVVAAPSAGTVRTLAVALGDTVAEGQPLLALDVGHSENDSPTETVGLDPDHIRPDLAEVLARRATGSDAERTDAVAKRHRLGLRSARENLDDLCDPGSFVEYGGLAIAAQRRRRSLEDLVVNTPADGMVAGTATVNAELVGAERAGAVVLSYDYTVLAGTQGYINHRKKDRIFELAASRRLPVVLFVEGGGGRPGDTDGNWASMLDVPTFEIFARLSALVPLVGVVAGRCFAGNAALAGLCDVIIAVEGANLGMGGPAMIEGGGLGVVTPDQVGPMSVQVPNGVVDILVPDEAAATRAARRYLSYFQGPVRDWTAPDQRALRHVVPENRVRVYEMRAVIDALADVDSVLELRPGFAAGMITALVRIEGRPMGLIANDPGRLGGAIDHDGADKAARFLQLCDAFGLPVVSLCDTPGFMVGPESETHATVRHFSRVFAAGANLSVPIGLVVTRKCYGLGGQAMMGGSLKAPAFAVAWPTGEFGGMGLEGAVRLGYRKELAAVDPAQRDELFAALVAAEYEKGKALSVAAVFEIDDVIDPADTRRWITTTFAAHPATRPDGKVRPHIDTW